MVLHSSAVLSVATPALPIAIGKSVPCRDVTQVSPRDEIRLVATLLEDAVKYDLSLALLLELLHRRQLQPRMHQPVCNRIHLTPVNASTGPRARQAGQPSYNVM